MAKSKTIKKVASDMRLAADIPDVAQKIATDFLQSTDAQKTDSSQAGNFLASLKEIFRNAPHHHQAVLRTVASVNVSDDFKVFAGFALTDLEHSTQYQQQASSVILANAKILQGAKGPKPEGFEFATHYGATIPESNPPAYPELVNVLNVDDLKLAINHVMSEQDITEEKAAGFFKEVIAAFKALKITPEDEDKLLSLIQQGTSDYSVLNDMIDDYLNAKTDKIQGSTPLQTHKGVTDFQPS